MRMKNNNRPRALLCTLFLAATALIGTVQSVNAQVGLSRVGPTDPVTGYPLWYEDSNGLKLGMCTDLNSCFFAPPDATQPPSYPTSPTDTNFNWPDELFYWACESSFDGNNGASALLVMALEGAYGGGDVKVGDNIVFARMRIRLTGLVPGAAYTVTHPYGTETLEMDAFGEVRMTRDIGIGDPGVFTGALKGDIGPFLVATSFTGGAPGDFIASGGITLQTVTGSPLGTNYFQVDGPGAAAAFPGNVVGASTTSVRNSEFAIMGQVASRFGVQADRVYYSKAYDLTTSVNIWASSSEGQSLVASVDNGPRTPLTPSLIPGTYFLRAELGQLAARPLSLTLTNISDLGGTSLTVPITDLIQIQSATYTMGGNLVVAASSSDQTDAQTLTVEADDTNATNLMTDEGLGKAAADVVLPPSSNPPASVLVESSAGGSTSRFVTVDGVGTTVGSGGGGGSAVLLANAGPDQSVSVDTTVALSGGDSIGALSYLWTHNAGNAITLSDPTSATPTFVTPHRIMPTGMLDVTFTLTVWGTIASSQDTSVVHISDPVAQAPDVITVLDARYLEDKEKWRVAGTAAVLQNQVVTIYLGDPILGRVLGDAIVDALGDWAFKPGGGSVTPLTNPIGTGLTHVWAVSSLPGTSGSLEFRIK